MALLFPGHERLGGFGYWFWVWVRTFVFCWVVLVRSSFLPWSCLESGSADDGWSGALAIAFRCARARECVAGGGGVWVAGGGGGQGHKGRESGWIRSTVTSVRQRIRHRRIAGPRTQPPTPSYTPAAWSKLLLSIPIPPTYGSPSPAGPPFFFFLCAHRLIGTIVLLLGSVCCRCLAVAAAVLPSHYRCLTIAVSLPLSHCLTIAVSLSLSHYRYLTNAVSLSHCLAIAVSLSLSHYRCCRHPGPELAAAGAGGELDQGLPHELHLRSEKGQGGRGSHHGPHQR